MKRIDGDAKTIRQLLSGDEVRRRMEVVMSALPASPTLSEGLRPNGSWGIDLTVPLRLVLGDVTDARDQEARLYAQVVPVVEALTADA